MFLDIRDQKHEMYAEGTSDNEPTQGAIVDAIERRGFVASKINISYDGMMLCWRFTANIKRDKQ